MAYLRWTTRRGDRNHRYRGTYLGKIFNIDLDLGLPWFEWRALGRGRRLHSIAPQRLGLLLFVLCRSRRRMIVAFSNVLHVRAVSLVSRQVGT